MKYCKQCGMQLQDGARFCPSCGAPAAGGEKGPHRKRKAGVRAVLLTVLILAVLGAAGGAAYLRSPVRKMMTELNDRKYDAAVRTYNKKIYGSTLYSLLADKRLQSYLEQAVEASESGTGSYEETKSLLEAVSGLSNGELSAYAEAKLSVLEDNEAAREAWEYAGELYENGEYMEALEMYAEVSADSAYYEQAQAQADECREAYIADILAHAENPADGAGYEACLAMLEAAALAFPEEDRLTDRLNGLTDEYRTLVKTEAISAANDALADQNYQEALETLGAALEFLETDDDLSALLSSASAAYENGVLEQADALAAAGDYDQALSALSDALVSLPDSTALSDKYDAVSADKPVRLADLKLSESGGDLTLITGQVVTTDTLGNIYSSGNLYKAEGGRKIIHEDAYMKYYLGGAYQTLVFTLAAAEDDEDWKEARELTVFGNNDEILYTSGGISRTTVPFEAAVNVAGAEWLYLKIPYIRDGVSLLIANPLLYK